jgi:ribosomal protein S18 acetylase RimI-like enzyme
MTADVQIRAATAADIEAVERLALQEFAPVLDVAFGARRAAVKLDVLVRLRRCRPEPVRGLLVAQTAGGAIAGFAGYTTAEMRGAGLVPRLVALRPLGVAGALRFAAAAALTFSRYRPGAGEVYLSGYAVEPRFRGQGIARRLLSHLEDETARQGYGHWTALVEDGNVASRSLLRRLDYRESPAPRRRGRALVRLDKRT